LIALAIPASVAAQSQALLIEAELPDDFDRGRNVSVQQQPRPGYDPIAVRVGELKILPKLELSAGASDNIYASPINPISGTFVRVAPSVRLSGDFTPLHVKLGAQADLLRFIGNSPRNETNWRVEPSAELDLADDYKIGLDLRAMRQTERPLAGEVDPEIAVLSHYTSFYGRLRGQYEAGQLRATIAVDDSIYNFSPIETPSGPVINQDDRDRNVLRFTAQGEYAVSPSLAAYAQLNHGRTSYENALAGGLANRDSTGWRATAGVNLDLSRLLRGTIGVGYTWRNYSSSLYDDVSGFSAEARLEYFPTELTTVTVGLRRSLQDSGLGSSHAFFDNRVEGRVDHALLRNLIVSLSAQYAIQDHLGLESTAKAFLVAGGTEYFISPNISIKGWLQYLNRDRHILAISKELSEIQGYLSLTIRP
jgi:hypothetical protein